MAFEPLSWLLSFALSRGATKGIEYMTLKTLEKDLNKAIQKWYKKLPKGMDFEFTSLFHTELLENEGSPEDIMILANKINDGIIPKRDDWHKALFYLWSLKKKELGKKANKFFLLDEDAASKHLLTLANDLTRVCKENEMLFQVTLATQVDEIMTKLDSLANKADNFYDKLAAGNQDEKLKQSFFRCEFKTKTELGVSISNSGLIVCSGESDELIYVKSLNQDKTYTVEKHITNGPQLHFIKIRESTPGLIPRYSFDTERKGESFITFDSDAKKITGKKFVSPFKWFNIIYEFLEFQNLTGMIAIALDRKYEKAKLTSCPVFNNYYEFVGISFARIKKRTEDTTQHATAITVLSWEMFSKYIRQQSLQDKKQK